MLWHVWNQHQFEWGHSMGSRRPMTIPVFTEREKFLRLREGIVLILIYVYEYQAPELFVDVPGES